MNHNRVGPAACVPFLKTLARRRPHLRRKIGVEGERIVTLRNVGYRMT